MLWHQSRELTCLVLGRRSRKSNNQVGRQENIVIAGGRPQLKRHPHPLACPNVPFSNDQHMRPLIGSRPIAYSGRDLNGRRSCSSMQVRRKFRSALSEPHQAIRVRWRIVKKHETRQALRGQHASKFCKLPFPLLIRSHPHHFSLLLILTVAIAHPPRLKNDWFPSGFACSFRTVV